MKDRVNPGYDEFDTAIGGLAPGGGWPAVYGAQPEEAQDDTNDDSVDSDRELNGDSCNRDDSVVVSDDIGRRSQEDSVSGEKAQIVEPTTPKQAGVLYDEKLSALRKQLDEGVLMADGYTQKINNLSMQQAIVDAVRPILEAYEAELKLEREQSGKNNARLLDEHNKMTQERDAMRECVEVLRDRIRWGTAFDASVSWDNRAQQALAKLDALNESEG
jgi:hypothetical protein